MIGGILVNLSLLGYFKYANFFLDNLEVIFGGNMTLGEIILPLGISFFIFQKIAFLVDAHRGEAPDFTWLNYFMFMLFFPQLIAGPIVHHRQFMSQLTSRFGRHYHRNMAVGLFIFTVGMFKKTVLADGIAPIADGVFNAVAAGEVVSPATAWTGALAYTFQLYFDFSAYSDMAVGLGRMVGIAFPINFNSPYKAASIIEFWRRWHITLSHFLRDYLYKPLGGNRKGPARRYINLGVVMLLGGLWHGANWTFVIWGAMHGAMLITNHGWLAVRDRLGMARMAETRIYRFVGVLVTFTCVMLAWVMFRAADFDTALAMWRSMFGLGGASVLMSFGLMAQDTLAHVAAIQAVAADFLSGNVSDFNVFLTRMRFSLDLRTTRPSGLGPILLYLYAIIIFTLPNVYQLLESEKPAHLDPPITSIPPHHRWRMNWVWASASACLAAIAILNMSKISPFLYFNF